MSDPTYRRLGRSGVLVSPLCLGTMMFGDRTDKDDATRIISEASDSGINFIDTADQYSDGLSEEIVGSAIKSNRDHWVLATKVGCQMPNGPLARGLSRRYVFQAIDRSLTRLGLDHVDIYYMHRPDPGTPLEESVQAFGDLIQAGKIRYIGLSNFRAWEITHIVHLCRQFNVPQPIVVQPYYNLMNRTPEIEVLPAAKHFGLGVAPYSPIARGILSGKYEPGMPPPEGSRVERGDARVLGSEWRPESIEIAAKLKQHATERGASLIEFAIAWVLNNNAISSAIVGPRTLEQWRSYLGGPDYQWTAEDEALVEKLVPTGHPSTPGYSDPSYPIVGRFAEKPAGA